MTRYECDTCHRLKSGDQEWILGWAAEKIGTVSARREISFEPEWSAERAVHPLAVHFWSVECKDKYLNSLFGNSQSAKNRAVVPIPKATSTRSARAQARTRKRA